MPYYKVNNDPYALPQLDLQTQQMQNVYGGTFFDAVDNSPLNLQPTNDGLVDRNKNIQGNTTGQNTGISGNGFSNAMNKGMAVAGGVMDLVGSYQDLAGIADTSQQWNQIEGVKDIGRSNYSDLSALTQDYTRMEGLDTSYDYRDIRGKNDGQLAMGVGSAMLKGASAGAAFGPWGILAGGAIGLGAGLAGVFTGNAKAKREQQWLQDNAIMAEHSATENLNAGHEQLRDYQFRSGISNRADWGGQIERRNQSIKEYADRVLHNKPKQISAEGKMHSIKRSHCNGGTMIRIKR